MPSKLQFIRWQVLSPGAPAQSIRLLPLPAPPPAPWALPPTGSCASPGWISAHFDNFSAAEALWTPQPVQEALCPAWSQTAGLASCLLGSPLHTHTAPAAGDTCKGHHIHPLHLNHTLCQCLQAPCLWPRSVAFIYYISLKEEVVLNPPKCLCACSQVPSHQVSCPATSATPLRLLPFIRFSQDPNIPALTHSTYVLVHMTAAYTLGVSPVSSKALPMVSPHHFPYPPIWKMKLNSFQRLQSHKHKCTDSVSQALVWL